MWRAPSILKSSKHLDDNIQYHHVQRHVLNRLRPDAKKVLHASRGSDDFAVRLAADGARFNVVRDFETGARPSDNCESTCVRQL